MYRKKLRHIIHNFADVKNDLKKKVLAKEIQACQLVQMTSSEMASSKVKQDRAKIKEASIMGRLITSKQRHLTKGHLSDRFTCTACGSNECTYRTRPSSYNSKGANQVIVHCIKCSNWWHHFGLFPQKRRRLSCHAGSLKEGATHYGATSACASDGTEGMANAKKQRVVAGGGGTGATSSCVTATTTATATQGEKSHSQEESTTSSGGVMDKLVMNFMEVTGGGIDMGMALRFIVYANHNVDEACLNYFRNPSFVPPPFTN